MHLPMHARAPGTPHHWPRTPKPPDLAEPEPIEFPDDEPDDWRSILPAGFGKPALHDDGDDAE